MCGWPSWGTSLAHPWVGLGSFMVAELMESGCSSSLVPALQLLHQQPAPATSLTALPLLCSALLAGSMSFPTISSIKSNNAQEHEQGSVQGALYGARALASGACAGGLCGRTSYFVVACSLRRLDLGRRAHLKLTLPCLSPHCHCRCRTAGLRGIVFRVYKSRVPAALLSRRTLHLWHRADAVCDGGGCHHPLHCRWQRRQHRAPEQRARGRWQRQW